MAQTKTTMTTYQTIQQAFANGTGDVFFSMNNSFVCFSRHDDNIEEMTAKGFKLMTHNEVLALAKTTENTPPTPVPTVVENLKKMAKSYDNCSNGRDGYYDEFPDAYGQNL